MGEQEATTDPAAIAATLTPAMRTMLLTGTPPAVNGMQTTAALCRRGLYQTQRPARGGQLSPLGRRVLDYVRTYDRDLTETLRLTAEWESLTCQQAPVAVRKAGDPAAGGFTDPGQAVTWLTGSIARLRARMPQQDPALLRPRGGSIYDRVTARAAYDVLTTLDRAVAAWIDMLHENHQGMARPGLVDEAFTAADIRVMLSDAAGQHGIAAEWAARDAS